MKHVIIDRPSLQSLRQRVVYGSVTLVFWVLWIYLWLPLLALVGWVLGIRIAYSEMVIRNGFAVLQGRIGNWFVVVAWLGGALLLWAYYNLARFHGSQRRRPRPAVTRAEQARHYGIAPAELARWTDSRRLVVHHDADGRITGADPGT
jgi:biofilm PGA synthesis protein PgaD